MLVRQKPPSNQLSAFLQKASSIDFGPIAYQLTHSQLGPHWTKAQAIEAITHYLAFLYLIDRYPHLQLVPTQEVDIVWHHHILDTCKYAEDCQHLFGYMMHHFPYVGVRGETDRRNHHQAYALTQVLYHKHFSGASAIDSTLPLADHELFHDDNSTLIPSGCARPQPVHQLRPRINITSEDMLHLFHNFSH